MDHAPPLRLAIDSTSLLGKPTGVGQYTAALIAALRNHQVEIWQHQGLNWIPPGPLPESLDGGPMPAASGPGTATLAQRVRRAAVRGLAAIPGLRGAIEGVRDRRSLARLRDGVRACAADIYHGPNFVAPSLDLPTVITVHDLSCFRYPEFHPVDRVRYMHKHMPASLARADRLIAVSEFTRSEIAEYFGVPRDRIAVILEAAAPHFRPVTAEQAAPLLHSLGLRWGEYFLFVGSLEPRKNLALVLEAYAALPDALQRRFPLVLAGARGWRRENFQARLSALLEAGRVRETGYLPDAALPALYASCTAFVYPSIYEGFGLPPLEAMACGAPVIVSRRASLPEVVGNAAQLVGGDDPAELAAALHRLAEDRDFAALLAARGSIRAREFSWARAASETLAAYRRAINERA